VFRHSPLRDEDSDIRPLNIQPGNGTDRIKCTFVLASLEDKPSYEALSYTWGDSTHKVPVFLDCCEFLVTQNLENAFRHLRLQDEQRIPWVDAVCIGQEKCTGTGSSDSADEMHLPRCSFMAVVSLTSVCRQTAFSAELPLAQLILQQAAKGAQPPLVTAVIEMLRIRT
jgi:hypothetical protein